MTWRVVLPIKMDKAIEVFITTLWNNRVNIKAVEERDAVRCLPGAVVGKKDLLNLIDLLNSTHRLLLDTFIEHYILLPYRRLLDGKITTGKYVESVLTIFEHGIVVRLLAQQGFRIRAIKSFHEVVKEASEYVLSKPTLEEAISAGYDVVANINIMLTGWDGREAVAAPREPEKPRKGEWKVMFSSDDIHLSNVALLQELETVLTKIQETGKRWALVVEPLETTPE